MPHLTQMVLLDHGLYRDLDEAFRINYCNLWKAMITIDTGALPWLSVSAFDATFSMFRSCLCLRRSLTHTASNARTHTRRAAGRLGNQAGRWRVC